jgi:hydroxypyruvate isomerase
MLFELSASIPALYGGRPFAAACAAAAADGFKCVELWDAPARPEWSDAAGALTTNNLSLTSVNSGAGEPPSFGVAADPAAAATWRAEFVETLDFARRAGAAAVNVLAGTRVVGQTRTAQLACLRRNLEWALGQLRDDDPTLLLEPLNGADRVSPLLCCVDAADAVLHQVGSDRVRLLFDAYHLYQEEPDLLVAFDRALPHIGHVQVADFPGRGEPGSGELPWQSFLAHVVRSGYLGRIGCEFLPTDQSAVPVVRAALAEALSAETAAVS